MYYAGWAAQDRPDEFALAAAAFRPSAGEALDHAARAQISVHGGIGATWEHDAPLYFRRAQLSRRLLGGGRRTASATSVARRAVRAGRGAAREPVHVWTHDRWRFPLPEHHRFPIDKYGPAARARVADGTVRRAGGPRGRGGAVGGLAAVHDPGLVARSAPAS